MLSSENRRTILRIAAFFVWAALINIAVHEWGAAIRANRQANLLIRNSVTSSSPEDPRYDLSAGEHIEEYLKYVPHDPQEKLSIVCGMSQMYAINNEKPGDRTITEWLDDMIRPHGGRAFGLAAPNLCNEEAVLLLLAATGIDRSMPSTFVYGICFDKFRNIDLRPSYLRLLGDRPDLMTRWGTLAKRYRSTYGEACAKLDATLETVRSTAVKEKYSFEEKVRSVISKKIPIVRERHELNALLQLGLYNLRNDLFGIKTSTKRPQIRSRYILNQQFLELFIDEARNLGVTPILYIVPLNPIAENPYIPYEYAEFKIWAEELARRKGCPFLNMESIVPKDDWGEFMGGPDYKHFMGEGHRKTAAALFQSFRPYLAGDQAQRSR